MREAQRFLSDLHNHIAAMPGEITEMYRYNGGWTLVALDWPGGPKALVQIVTTVNGLRMCEFISTHEHLDGKTPSWSVDYAFKPQNDSWLKERIELMVATHNGQQASLFS